MTLTRVADRPTWLLSRAHARAHRILRQGFEAEGVRGYHFRLLAAMEQYGPSSQADLGRNTGIDRSDVVATLDDQTLTAIVARVFRPGTINVQKYVADQGGYPYWHCELYPKMDNGETLHRVVLWTIYLNDRFSEGETEFLYQQRRIPPRTGSLLIAPTAFTHTHRGNMPKGADKYIATSWVLFNRAETLFAQPQPPKGRG